MSDCSLHQNLQNFDFCVILLFCFGWVLLETDINKLHLADFCCSDSCCLFEALVPVDRGSLWKNLQGTDAGWYLILKKDKLVWNFSLQIPMLERYLTKVIEITRAKTFFLVGGVMISVSTCFVSMVKKPEDVQQYVGSWQGPTSPGQCLLRLWISLPSFFIIEHLGVSVPFCSWWCRIFRETVRTVYSNEPLLCVLENVLGLLRVFNVVKKYLDKLTAFRWCYLVIDPRRLGDALSRRRVYIILVHKPLE